MFRENARQMNIDLNDAQLAQFTVYKNELLLWNAKTNLISEKSSREIITRHFLDSLTALPFMANPDARIIDIGCGAGFPGLPLKIAQPRLKVHLLEANRKKVSFLKHILRLLRFSDVVVLHDRFENIIRNNAWKEKFDFLVSRAALKLPALQALGGFFLTPDGEFIAWKGPNVEEEIQQSLEAQNDFKKYELIQHDIELSFLEIPRKIIIGKP
ncbi:MAG: 16S rRNA (guanine(527)-N(7))-methyltransferase RsmG [Smithella sp.]|nr:16S rRNA (guanine(527)-N(7))-methyltransferase RsmG [Smithella sp.]